MMGHNVVTLAWMERLGVPSGSSVLDLGPQDIIRYMPDNDDERVIVQGCEVARDWYALKGFGEYASVDLNDERATFRRDLNDEIALPRSWDVIYDGGFAEHVFNIGQVFRICHELCATGGLMLHALPMTGGFDHGFWNVQPRVYRGLAEANGYELVDLTLHENIHAAVYEMLGQPNDPVHVPMGMALAALRKIEDAPFRVPQQGGTTS